ncbi:MAG: tRNA (N6-threonylcarbamoyladenosine(37)-N6)-methyltransferase TrmO [Actinobacteria bacterium]|nr:tRNA (N6-threonylcarbamoyladenosine(37)-N6)-methyltransferase TrmO [Actinomycetota bacterium]
MAPSLEPIGYVRTRVSPEEVKAAWEELQSEIEILEAYEAGLTGIDGFSHLFVLTYLHEVSDEARSTMNVKPRGLLRFGLTLEELPTIGVFACDSPMRPNPIGVTVVRLLGREGRVLRVRGLDAFDGTPVLDLKPYGPDRVIPDVRVPGWHEELTRKAGTKRV